MSELFKWLSKVETKRVNIRPVPVPDQENYPEPRDDAVDTVKPALDLADSSQGTFDLSFAGYKIASVLEAQTQPGEQFRFLRARLSQLQRQKGFKKILITSSIPSEGKTFTACCLAGMLAQEAGKRVLLMDADLRKPNTAQTLGLGRRAEMAGLSHILQGTHKLKDALLRSSSTDFFYLPPGEVPENPSELLAPENLERIFTELVNLFDWIIIDSPPVLNIADPTTLAPLCDAVIMVVRANQTPAKMIQKSIQMLGKDLVCGIVLNRARNLPGSRYYYHYYSSNGKRIR